MSRPWPADTGSLAARSGGFLIALFRNAVQRVGPAHSGQIATVALGE